VSAEKIEEAVRKYDGGEYHTSLSTMDGSTISGLDLKYCEVEVAVRFPRLQLVYIECGSQQELLWVSKKLVPDWRAVTERCLDAAAFEEEAAKNPHGVADALVRILVDPDTNYGFLISSHEEIPTDLHASDVYRDLVRQGLTKLEIRKRLLQGVPKGIGPPRLVTSSTGQNLVFFSWSYFGGNLVKWTVRLGNVRMTIDYEVMATNVGSFDYYM